MVKSTQDVVMLGADFYETDDERAAMLSEGKVPIGIGENTIIRFDVFSFNLYYSC
jgi:hypothetical protein